MLLSVFRPAPVAHKDIRSAFLEHADSLKTYCARLSTAGQQAEELGDEELASHFRTAVREVMKADFSLKRRSEEVERRYHQEVIKTDFSLDPVKHRSEDVECRDQQSLEQNSALSGEYEELLKEVEAAEVLCRRALREGWAYDLHVVMQKSFARNVMAGFGYCISDALTFVFGSPVSEDEDDGFGPWW